ncbi:phenylacetate--CoA ligase family protein [Sporosarcina sp. HYO08]|uniref:phenylacetate--CoA ligase family protein n=1 Tax=Sporosarcina sp. HYO08 TaxID=1759557 RepID=UPI000797B021|nr:AMP-binding protein [Sporosarcina sp. HYO08]KXH82092.1 phenylacetate--CoA ligase [Sporosarcina sp. HYO08]
METLSRPEMEALQLERLQETAEKVYKHVNFYKQKFEELGVTPKDIKSLDDISKLPFTIKGDLRDNYPFGLFAVSQDEIVRLHASSGTSGKPTVVGYTRNDIDNWAEVVARAVVSAGGRKGDIFHNTYGYGLFTGGIGVHYGVEKLGAAVVPISGGNTERQVMLIDDFKPRGISGTPSYIMTVAEKMKDMGINPRETSIEYGIFGAEPWSEEMRHRLEETFDLKAVDIYGLSEIIGPGVSIECHEAQDGLHIQEDHFYVEVIDPKTLEAVAEGEEGELVITSLTKEAFPVIRYRTGDIASITREKCKCGRTTTRMSRIKGRTDDMIILRGVNVFPSEIERVLLQVEDLVPNYQIHRLQKGTMESVELHVEITNELYNEISGDLVHPKIQKLSKEIVKAISSNCLVSMGVIFNKPNTLPKSEGKAIRIIDLREKKVLVEA